jgi:hypothetical protein
MRPVLILAALAFAAPSPAFAVPGGAIETLEDGRYTCSTLGDATGAALVHVPEADFQIRISSSYEAGDRRGVYLRLGDRVTMTSGPFRGTRFLIDSNGFLQRLGPNGERDGVSCSIGVPPGLLPTEDCEDDRGA